jgi:2,3-diketo-5-methylthio-1-phosphopentane phosphatase
MSLVNVVCDFDGTITLEDVTDGLLEKFAHPSWKEIEAQWLAGQFGSRECMARQVALINATYEELDRYLDGVAMDPSFPAFVLDCEVLGNVGVTVVSDGIDYAVKRIMRNNGLSRLAVKANALVRMPDNRFSLDFPHSALYCNVQAGNCKCAVAHILSSTFDSPSVTILIGDGTSDFCIASHVDFVLAKDRLLDHCIANALPHLPFNDFTDVRQKLTRVVGVLYPATQSLQQLSEAPSDT